MRFPRPSAVLKGLERDGFWPDWSRLGITPGFGVLVLLAVQLAPWERWQEVFRLPGVASSTIRLGVVCRAKPNGEGCRCSAVTFCATWGWTALEMRVLSWLIVIAVGLSPILTVFIARTISEARVSNRQFASRKGVGRGLRAKRPLQP